LNWRETLRKLNSLTEEQLWALLEEEVTGKRRVSVATRLHMRICRLRDSRERLELLKRLTSAT